MQKRGILMAVSSLPGRYGIGDFAAEAYDFIRVLEKNEIKIWQILPLNPLGFGNSPYQPLSSFAFDEIYISLNDLKRRNLISRYIYLPTSETVDYSLARATKERAIYFAFKKFSKNKKNLAKLDKFISENPFVGEYATYITLKELNGSKSWNEWCVSKESNKTDFDFAFKKHMFAQMLLFEEWAKIKKFANDKGIEIMGDIPFYVGYDSSDVYYHKDCFYLDDFDRPTCVAGVPPDYFSKDGQRWGNPIYNWEHLENTNYSFLINRIGFASKIFDIIRLDHFRAFDSYWSINPDCLTAIDGEWKFPKGYDFFDELYKTYPNINIVAEDLGLLRPEVYELRDHYSLPGMRELQFTIFEDEFSDNREEKENMYYYTSTHDNEIMKEWCDKLSEYDYRRLDDRMNELNLKGNTLAEKLVSYSLNRKEKVIIINVTDLLDLNYEQRMNTPGVISERNWTFKLTSLDQIDKELSRQVFTK